MPPAFVLSQDQTLKFDVRLAKGGIPSAKRSFQGAVPAQFLITYGYVLGHVRPFIGANSNKGLGTVNLLQVTDALKPPDLEPPPTCPFI